MASEVSYKEVMIPKRLVGLNNHMSDVEGYREELRILGGQWDLLTILGQMSGTGMDMTKTRLGFQHLTSELLSQLGLETLKTTIQDLSSKAQVAVDIVIRNLFERTADIGFLATDDDVRRFLKTSINLNKQLTIVREDGGDDEQIDCLESIRSDHMSREAKMVERFQEYVAKYSVYFNIILLDTNGNVLVQLDSENNVKRSTDSLLREALETKGDFVEVFRQSDLLNSQDDSLIYAYRVTENNDASSSPLGVLCLCFRFENEMEGIFKNLHSEGDWSVMTLLDQSGRVIASSDPYHIPLGVTIDFDLDAEFKIMRFGGREYLAKTCATKGYQGFYGLGWLGHVMIPIEHAFDKEASADLQQRIDETVLAAVLNDPQLFSKELRSIPVQADYIQDELERTVWNGNVRESEGQSKVLLWNISDAGARTKSVFEQSIGNLHQTVVCGILKDVEFQAALAVDIMDRNLYERANDCRWWALTTAFREILSQPNISTQDTEKISSILAYINGLYTVYTNLFVYDVEGRILAVSNTSESRLLNTKLSDDWVRETLSLKNSQSYSVSHFDATSLYNNRHTYIYGAAITDIHNEQHCVGGIGIVFDSEPQFEEMLRDSLPRNERGEVADGCFGIFADRKGKIVSSTSSNFPVGKRLDIDLRFFSFPKGEGVSGIIEIQGQYYAIGAKVSSGYREYKIDDGYVNEITGLVFVPLAEVVEDKKKVLRRREVGMSMGNTRDTGQDCMELATFYIGTKWLGIRAERVIEAVNSEGLTTLPGTDDFVVGSIIYKERVITVIDIRTQMGLAKEDFDPSSPIIIIETENNLIGLVVDALGEIPAVSMDRVENGNVAIKSRGNYIEYLIKPLRNSESKELLVVLDPNKILSLLICEESLLAAEPAKLLKKTQHLNLAQRDSA